MMRSLWAGVSGLQAHQIAMDVEGNNIANVNTAGFKYSRANFSDMLSQTAKIATAPQGELGGKNPMQIGLGTQVSTVTRIFKQGSVQTTDKNTDLAIQGDGFFVVSPDGGNTYKFTRNGDFTFDALGNFSDSNGYIIQGWMRDEATGEIDSTAPIANIQVPPGLTTPARDTSYITLKANLNSGDSVISKSAIYSLDSYHGWNDNDSNGIQDSTEVHNENANTPGSANDRFNVDKQMYERGEDFGVLFDTTGKSFKLNENQGLWVSYADAKLSTTVTNNTIAMNMKINGVEIKETAQTFTTDEDAMNYIIKKINEVEKDTGVRASSSAGALVLTNTNQNGTESDKKNIDLYVDTTTDTTGLLTQKIITAFQYTYTTGSVSPATSREEQRKFKTTEDLRIAMQTDARINTDYLGNGFDDATEIASNLNDGVTVTVNNAGQFEIINKAGDAFNISDGDIITSMKDSTTPWSFTNTSIATLSGTDYVLNENTYFPPETIFQDTLGADVQITVGTGGITLPVGASYDTVPSTGPFSNIVTPATIVAGTVITIQGLDTTSGAVGVEFPLGTTFSANIAALVAGTDTRTSNDHAMNITITELSNETDKVSTNILFTSTMKSLQGSLPSGDNVRTSQNIFAASHASSIDIYDSLGSKHTIRFEFRKVEKSTENGALWNMIITAPNGSYISDVEPRNIMTGYIQFDSTGALSIFSPPTISLTANNGSEAAQNIRLDFGTTGEFDGVTSFDKESNTSGIAQDGYPGGDLAGIRIDETGTLIGSFTNGRSFGLAQVAMANFTNNEGLESDGGNTFIQTSNSGDPVIGRASVGGRGFIQASALEMSNVDLSRSLTQLIVIQRGYQASSKTITTSDQMLNTLLQLKQ